MPLFVAILIFLFIVVGGWALAFAFASTVIVPFLGIPAAYAKIAAFLLAFLFDGIGAFIVTVVIIGLFLIGLSKRR